MVKTAQDGFWDGMTNQKVYYWQDCYFDVYLACSIFGPRVKIK